MRNKRRQTKRVIDDDEENEDMQIDEGVQGANQLSQSTLQRQQDDV